MKIYKTEIADGISSKVESSGSIEFEVKLKTPTEDKSEEIVSQASEMKSLLENACDRKDLAAIQSILVSTGWNGNTDIFTPEQLWAARLTPILKQVNLGHTDKIVGTMVHSFATDFDGNVLSNDLEDSEIPDDFDIVVDSVLFTRHPNLELREEVAELLPKIANGEAYVSMECFFNDFDYGVIDAKGEKFIVPRNEETAWMTKHLLQFGGEGSIDVQGNHYTIGRVIKNLTFSGQGIVENPANKRSRIFSTVQSFAAAKLENDSRFVSQSQEITNKEDDMSQETVSLKEFNDLKAKLNELENKEKQDLSDKLEAALAEVTRLEGRVEELETEAEIAAETKNSEAQASADALKEKSDELEAKVKELDEVSKELSEMKANVAIAERVNKLVSIGKSEEDAKEIVAKWDGCSDEQFASVVEMHDELVKAAKSDEEAEAEESDEEETSASLNVEDEGETAPVIDNKDETADDEIEAAASYMSILISRQKNK